MDLYPWLKALHVAAAFLFVGGTLANALVLATLGVEAPSPGVAECGAAAWRWNRAVTTPAMLAVWALGLTIALDAGWFAEAWLRVKLVAVVALSGLHGVQSGLLRRAVAEGRPPRRLRAAGPAIAALAVAIAVLAVAKPF